jgi:replicative DNA helicase
MTIPTERPQDYNAERGVIASCIVDPDCAGRAADRNIKSEAFLHPTHKIVYSAIESMWSDGVDIDELTIAERLKARGLLEEVGGFEGINTISSAVETSLHFDMWAEQIESHFARRRLQTLCMQTLDGIAEKRIEVGKLIETLDTEIINLTKERFKQEYFYDSVEAVSVGDVSIKERIEAKGKIGVPSGINALDFKLKGFKKAEMTLLAARPSVGKTAFSLHCLKQAAVDNRVPTLYMSIEMSTASLMTRLIQSVSNVPLHVMDAGLVNENQQKAIDSAQMKLQNAPFWIDETPSPSVAQIRARARRMKASNDLGLLIIDYLQLISARDPRVQREQQVAEMSTSLKNLAKELDIPILLLCQLNRQSEINSRAPKLSDLRESGQLEQDCDVCLMLWRPDMEEEQKVQCDISKNRNGQVGSTLLSFQKNVQRFTPYIESSDEDDGDYYETNKQPRFGK